MKALSVMACGLIFCGAVNAQELDDAITTHLETIAAETGNEDADENVQQEFEWLLKHPLDINTATKEEWTVFPFITPLHVNALQQYKNLFGRLLSVYELQAVPGWHVDMLQKLFPYIRVKETVSSLGWKDILSGDHYIRIRNKRIMEMKRGFRDTNGYAGSPDHVFASYRYKAGKLVDLGFTFEKDAGEKFFAKPLRPFDFHSYHIFLRPPGVIRSVAIGDYTVNMGQGLVHWQSMGFGKGSLVTNIKREGEMLRPYSGSGEFNFHRGGALRMAWKRLDALVFASSKKLSAGIDSSEIAGSISYSGLHRTKSELAGRRRMQYSAAGGAIRYKHGTAHIGVHGVAHHFSFRLKPAAHVYNRYDMVGKFHANLGADFSITAGNAHYFTEFAIDRMKGKAVVAGLLVAADRNIDLAFLFRSAGMRYRAYGANAFTENTDPENETGFYMGITCRPASGWQLDGYSDFFLFPFVKYRVDRPSKGIEQLLMVSWKPSKAWDLSIRFRQKVKEQNDSREAVLNELEDNRRKALKFSAHNTGRAFQVKLAAENVWSGKGEGQNRGFLGYVELAGKLNRRLSGNLRVTSFQADHYDARIYAYESGLPYSGGMAVFDGSGCRFYLNTNLIISKWMSVSFRVARTIYTDKTSIGTGLEEIFEPHRTQLEIQAQGGFRP